jgi:L-alanine-DL-glutamate epimerase-like enolase superfamily enzyme
MQRCLQADHDCYALSRPFRISRGTKTSAHVLRVTLRQGDVVGRGEGVPYPRYGESIDTALAGIEAVRPAVEEGASREALQDLLSPGAARNAIDCAMWDLEARLAGVDVAAVVGGAKPGPIASALTISLDAPAAMGEAARRVSNAPLIKVKVDAIDPMAQIRAVRMAAPAAALIVDPNESWDEALLRAIEPVLVEARVALLEQPVPAGADEWLEDYSSTVPICADESFHTAADLAAVARRYGVVNIKLDKTGGLTAALHAAREARAAGLGLMTGCMVSSSLSIAPAFHIAAQSDFVDLDGPLWLADDWAGGVTDEQGTLVPPDRGFWGQA